MVLQNYKKFTEMNSNMIYIFAYGVALKCPCKIHYEGYSVLKVFYPKVANQNA